MDDKEKVKILRKAVEWAIEDMKSLPRSWGYSITSIPRMLEALEKTGDEKRICSTCNQSLDIDCFYLRSDREGPRSICKECSKAHIKQYKADNPERAKSWSKGKSKGRCRKEPRHKYLARQAVAKAIKEGALTRPDSCGRCGDGGIIEGHHHDYSKQLDVEWLCKSCHYQEHNKAPVDG